MIEFHMWRIETVKSRKGPQGTSEPKEFWSSSPLDAMQRYVRWVLHGEPETELGFTLRATKLDHPVTDRKYPYYTERSDRVLDMFTNARMAIHVDPTLQGSPTS